MPQARVVRFPIHTMMLLISAALLCATLVAETPRMQPITQKGQDHFSTQFASGQRLKLDIRSGGVRIVGTDNNQISVHFEGRKASELDDVEVQFRPTGDGGTLKISGGPRNDFEIRIEVPRDTALHVRMPFGELDMQKIRGDKNVELHAGEINIDMGDPSDYSRIEASVLAGEVDSRAMGVSKGGLFRSFEKSGAGKYKLYAHVGSGQVNLN